MNSKIKLCFLLFAVLFFTHCSGSSDMTEGTIDAPVVLKLTSLPYTGSADSDYSYYKLTGLTAGNGYVLSISDSLAIVEVYNDSGYKNKLCKTYSDSATNALNCAFNAPAASVFFRVKFFDFFANSGSGVKSKGSTFKINCTSRTPFADEGSMFTPVVVALSAFPLNGTVLAKGTSWYQVNGLTAGATYSITVNSPFEPVGFIVYADNISFSILGSSGGYGNIVTTSFTAGGTSIVLRVDSNPQAIGPSGFKVEIL